MSLPVSADYMMVPQQHYSNSNQFYLPNLNVMPMVSHMTKDVAICVANTATAKAGSNACRLFCYNLLMNGNWQNEYFIEVVKLSLDYLCKSVISGLYRTPETGLEDAVNQILTLYSSNLVFLFPDLKAKCSQKLLDAAFQNVPVFNNLKQELQSMYNSPHENLNKGNTMSQPQYPQQMQPQYQQPMGQPQYPQQYPQPMYPQQVPQQYPQQYPQPMYPQYQPQFPPQYPQQMPPQYPQQMPQPTFNQGPPQQSNFDGQRKWDTGREFDRRAIDDTNSNVQIVSPKITELNGEAKIKRFNLLEIKGGTEVERSKHKISYFNEHYAIDGIVKYVDYTASVNKLNEAVISIDEDVFTEDIQVLSPSWIVEVSEDSAIINGRIRKFESQVNSSTNDIFRCFSTVTIPIFTKSDISAYIKRLRESGSLYGLSVTMMNIVGAVRNKSDDENLKSSVIDALSIINNELTKLINTFCRYSIKINEEVENFAEDIKGLPEYLLSNYSNVEQEAFYRFESDIMHLLLMDSDVDLVYDILSIEKETKHKDLFLTLFPINYSFTYLTYTENELGYIFTKGSSSNPIDSCIIKKETFPNLYNIANSLSLHKKQVGMSTLYDLLITADNVKYKITSSYKTPGDFMLTKHF